MLRGKASSRRAVMLLFIGVLDILRVKVILLCFVGLVKEINNNLIDINN